MWRDAGVNPLCSFGDTPERCEVFDVAPDITLNEYANKYLAAKRLGDAGRKDYEVQLVKELGLFDDPALLFQLETIWAKSISIEREKREQFRKGKEAASKL